MVYIVQVTPQQLDMENMFNGPTPGSEYTTAQMSEICENLKLALDFLVTETVTPVDALKMIECCSYCKQIQISIEL